MKKELMFAAVGEAATGVALLILPSVVEQVLLGDDWKASPFRSTHRGARPDCVRDRLVARPSVGRYVDL